MEIYTLDHNYDFFECTVQPQWLVYQQLIFHFLCMVTFLAGYLTWYDIVSPLGYSGASHTNFIQLELKVIMAAFFAGICGPTMNQMFIRQILGFVCFIRMETQLLNVSS